MGGKFMMFAQVSLANFSCDVIVAFCLPNEKVKNFYEVNKNIKCSIYQLLTDTDGVSP